MKTLYIGKTILLEDVDGERTLVVGDLHLGYGESMRDSGIGIPIDIYGDILREFDLVFDHIVKKYGKIDRVVLLGDLKHEFGRISRGEWKEVLDFLDYLRKKVKKSGEIIVVRGNHDVFTNFVTKKKGVEVVDYYSLGDCVFVHGDKDFSVLHDKKIKKWFIAHGHPAIFLREGIKKEKYKCFLKGKYRGKEIFILPSFSGVNEGSDVKSYDLNLAWNFDLEKFKVKVVNENSLQVLDFGVLKNID